MKSGILEHNLIKYWTSLQGRVSCNDISLDSVLAGPFQNFSLLLVKSFLDLDVCFGSFVMLRDGVPFSCLAS